MQIDIVKPPSEIIFHPLLLFPLESALLLKSLSFQKNEAFGFSLGYRFAMPGSPD
jgi:hypothetical protein